MIHRFIKIEVDFSNDEEGGRAVRDQERNISDDGALELLVCNINT
jgi:hypothetical protein